jgi:xylose isomerase
MGGFTTGGLNFDAKRRRESFEPIDLVYAHIGGMDTIARGLKTAAAIRADGRLADFIRQRYRSFDVGFGADVEAGKLSLEDLEKIALEGGEPVIKSGHQEMLENLLNDFI